jgi:hypothetical protein
VSSNGDILPSLTFDFPYECGPISLHQAGRPFAGPKTELFFHGREPFLQLIFSRENEGWNIGYQPQFVPPNAGLGISSPDDKGRVKE